ncbi:MAG TPA: glycosyltransferase [Bacteroidota bacterium]
MDLSVIIVNYNVRDFLENALVSLQKAAEGLSVEFFVVDNASDDGSVDLVKQKFPSVSLIENHHNLGFAKANNQALRIARGRYFLLINPDTVVQEDTLRVLIKFFEENPDVGMAGCKILNPDGTLQLPCRRSFPTPWVAFCKMVGLSALFSNTKAFGKYNLTYLNPDESYEVDAVSGSFMMLRRRVYEEVGDLDEDFFMYGEDLDWCFRIQRVGWKVYYVHTTQIIHYKGESAKRSDFDEIKTFYQAMNLFVRKHLGRSLLLKMILQVGIALRGTLAFLARAGWPILFAMVDFIGITAALIAGEFIWFGKIFHFPGYAYPVVYVVPNCILLASLYFSGVYSYRKNSLSSTALSVTIGYLILSTLTFFFKEYAFSRMVVVISGALTFMVLVGWRLLLRYAGRTQQFGRGLLLGRRTLVVGTGASGLELLRKLRARVVDGYDVIGFIDMNRKRLGEKISGVQILGSIDNIGKVIRDKKVSEVIFSTDTLPYRDILSVIGRSRERAVNYRLVPTSLEVIIGKTNIDRLEDIPLVDIEYNIDKPLNRFSKRTFDIIVSVILLIFVYPFVYFDKRLNKRELSAFSRTILALPRVLTGERSVVGRPEYDPGPSRNGAANVYLGKVGLTGLAQINRHEGLTTEEIEKYNLFYAKNQSLMLDIEILFKTALQRERGKV